MVEAASFVPILSPTAADKGAQREPMNITYTLAGGRKANLPPILTSMGRVAKTSASLWTSPAKDVDQTTPYSGPAPYAKTKSVAYGP